MENVGLTISKKMNAVLHLLLMTVVLICILPVILVICVSFTDEGTLREYGYQFFVRQFSLSSYKFIFQVGEGIVQAYGVTILVTVVGTLLSLLIIAMFAYPLSRKDLKYRNKFMFFLFFTTLFNGGLVSWYLICTQFLHLTNTLWALVLPYVMNGFYVIVLRTFFSQSIPAELIESAKIDGAGELRTFFRIVLPLSLPGLATIAIFAAVGFWNDYFLPLMLITEPRLYNLQYLIYRVMTNIQFLSENSDKLTMAQISYQAPKESARMALAVITIGPIVAVYPWLQKYFIKGLTVGAVKG
nr:carbohydrate ABC transporter permease [Gorillibacterium timonense]